MCLNTVELNQLHQRRHWTLLIMTSNFLLYFHLNQSVCTLPPPSNLHLTNWHLPVSHWNCKQTAGGIFLPISKALLIETHKLLQCQAENINTGGNKCELSYLEPCVVFGLFLHTSIHYNKINSMASLVAWYILIISSSFCPNLVNEHYRGYSSLAGGTGELIPSLGVTVT